MTLWVHLLCGLLLPPGEDTVWALLCGPGFWWAAVLFWLWERLSQEFG